MKTKAPRQVIYVFSFFLLLLLGWFIFSLTGVVKGLETNKWPVTDGTVISSEVKRLNSSKGSSKSAPLIRYQYKVGSEEFTSEKYSSTVARGSSSWARDIVDMHPAGTEVKVHYNPGQPSRAVLVTGLQSDDYWMTLLSLIGFLLVLWAFVKQINPGNK